MKIEAFIIQFSAVEDRSPQEEAAAAEGLIPIVVFANGPENAYLVRARPEDIQSALDEAWSHIDAARRERQGRRAGVFTAMAEAVESDFASAQGETDFPKATLFLFAEALADEGVDALDDIEPCAVRFVADALMSPNYETARAD